MPVPDPSSSVNERPDSPLLVDNDKPEVIKNGAAVELKLSAYAFVNMQRASGPEALARTSAVPADVLHELSR